MQFVYSCFYHSADCMKNPILRSPHFCHCFYKAADDEKWYIILISTKISQVFAPQILPLWFFLLYYYHKQNWTWHVPGNIKYVQMAIRGSRNMWGIKGKKEKENIWSTFVLILTINKIGSHLHDLCFWYNNFYKVLTGNLIKYRSTYMEMVYKQISPVI